MEPNELRNMLAGLVNYAFGAHWQDWTLLLIAVTVYVGLALRLRRIR